MPVKPNETDEDNTGVLSHVMYIHNKIDGDHKGREQDTGETKTKEKKAQGKPRDKSRTGQRGDAVRGDGGERHTDNQGKCESKRDTHRENR